MATAIQAKCPRCKTILRIPADWIDETVRCKHCGAVVHVKVKSKSRAPALPAPEPPAKAEGPADQPRATQPALDANLGIAFAAQDDGLIVRVPARYRSRRRGWVALLTALGFLAVIATSIYFARDHLTKIRTDIKDLLAEEAEPGSNASANKGAAAIRSDPNSASGEAFPRRLLAIYAHDYLYANPVLCGDPQGEQNFHTLVQRLIQVLHVPEAQAVELSDVPAKRAPAPPKRSKGKAKTSQPPAETQEILPACPPLKPVIEQTIQDFLASCRAQDRLIVLFIGHVVELDGEGYLVPLEGDMSAKESLIPLAWLYQRLEACKARQKVLVFDTGRLDPSQGLERPGSGPLGAKLDSRLANPPTGVQVWSACTAAQYSYELDGNSVFLEAWTRSLTHKVIQKIQEPEDPFPVEALAKEVERLTAAAVSECWNAKQTPRLSGAECADGASYDKAEPPPARIPPPSLPRPAEGMAPRQEILGILVEIDLPPMRWTRGERQILPIDALLSFSAGSMEAYQADYRSIKEIKSTASRYPLRSAVLDALEAIRTGFNPASDAFSLLDSFPAGNSEQRNKEIRERQMKQAKVLALLTEALDNLRQAGEGRDAEKSKRWQAHYDYVLATLLARMAYVSEYDLMLGKIRKEELPELKPNVDTGWRLASRDKLSSGKEVKEMVAESRKILAKLIKQHPGTPWEVLARRERVTALGLEWQTTR
jgi:phage FluMu protein Com